MRNSTASILWILIFAFGVLWVLADTQMFDALAVGPRSLGQVNGDEISLEEYNNRVSFYTDQFAMAGGDAGPEMRSMYENQAWEDLVAARLIQQKMNDLGIIVTDNELVEMITGDNPDPFIRQQFQDENGVIDQIALRAAIEAPENREIWLMIEQQLRDARRQQKLNNYIASGFRASSLDIKNEYIRSNSYADIRYLRFPYGEVTDDEISLTDEELRSYYRNNPSEFTRSESYRFRYVSWDKTPTPQDTLRTIQDVENLREAFAEAENDSLFILRNQSSTPFRGAWVDINDLRPEYRPVVDLEPGEVSEVELINGDPYVFKKIDQRGDEIRFAVLSYRVEADLIATIDRQAEHANEFEFYASSDGFEQEAERRDMEILEASATRENPFIPGLGRSQQTLNILENLRVNRISEPIELDDQFIVLQLLEKTPEGTRPFNEVRSQIENSVRNQKREEIMLQRVQEVLSGNSGHDLETIASEAETEIQIAENVRMNGTSIPRAGREPGVIGSIFSLEPGQLSGALRGESAVFVVEVDNLSIADASEMSTAQREEIRNRLEQQKFVAFNEIFIDRLKEGANIRDNRSRLLR